MYHAKVSGNYSWNGVPMALKTGDVLPISLIVCPHCSDGKMLEQSVNERRKYVCNTCGGELVSREQLNHNTKLLTRMVLTNLWWEWCEANQRKVDKIPTFEEWLKISYCP